MNALFEHPLTARLGWTLLHFLWQGAAIAALLAAGNYLARAARPALRYALSCVALFLMATFPVITFAVLAPATEQPAAPAVLLSASLERPEADAGFIPEVTAAAPVALVREVPADHESTAAGAAIPEFEKGAGREFWPAVAVAIWLAGIALLSIRQGCGLLRLRSLRRDATAIEEPALLHVLADLKSRLGITAPVRLLASARLQSPAVIGFLRPIILFPFSAFTGLSQPQLAAVLAHELAHIRRWDFPVNFLQRAVETILFYHPGVWWVSSVVRREREFCADDLALEVCNDRRCYAAALTALAEMESDGLAVAATGGNLLARIQRIVGRPEPRRDGAFTVVVSLFTAGFFASALLLSRGVAQESPGIEVKAGESLQAAIDAAPEGAVIRVAAGDFPERIRISKPITLLGAGWDKTSLLLPADDQQKRQEHETQVQAAKTPEERDALIQKGRAAFEGPTLSVIETKGVSLRGLRVRSWERGDANRAAPPLAIIRGAQMQVADCAFTGPGQDGIHILDQSTVEITNSLVAGLWGEGIVIAGTAGADPKVTIRDSELRNVHHYGIQIGRGCDRVAILRCRISGMAWHGIRYDSASPLIEGNTIAFHARSGIYASGRTRATVRGNLFFRNEMNGISCWFNNEDLIERNTFAENLREGAMVLDASKPRIHANIFWNNPIAVVEGTSNSGGTPTKGTALLENNFFWKNEKNRPVNDQDSLPRETKSLLADPGFVNTAATDFRLLATSAAAQAGAGAPSPLALASPWPILPEEKQLIPEGASRDSNAWKKPGAPAQPKANIHQTRAQHYQSVEPLVKEALQIDDVEKRKAAVEKIRAMIGSKDPHEAARGLVAYASIGPVSFDKTSFRELLLTKLESEDPFVRSQAIGALSGGAGGRGDLPRIIELSKDDDHAVRAAVAWAMVWLTQKDLTGPEGATWMEMFEAGNAAFRKEMIHGLWGVKTTTALQERLVSLSREDRGLSYDILYYALSTSPNKQAACVTRLIDFLADADTTNVAGRAAWGLGYGVVPEEQPRVADAMLKLYDARDDGYLRKNALGALGSYAGATHLPALEQLAAKPGISEQDKQKLDQIIVRVKQSK